MNCKVFLSQYNLCSFTHRLFIRLDLFIYKIINSSTPPILNECMIVDTSDNIANRLKSRRKKLNYEPHFTTGFGFKTFDFFSSIFYNNFLLSKRHISLFSFKSDLYCSRMLILTYTVPQRSVPVAHRTLPYQTVIDHTPTVPYRTRPYPDRSRPYPTVAHRTLPYLTVIDHTPTVPDHNKP